MSTTNDLLDEFCAVEGISVGYKLAERLQVSPQAVSNWRRGKDTPSDQLAVEIARCIEKDPIYVMAVFHREREKNKIVKMVWARLESIAIKLTTSACVAGMLITGSLNPRPVDASEVNGFGDAAAHNGLYIMRISLNQIGSKPPFVNVKSTTGQAPSSRTIVL